ncbi:FecCD family ABC transporter permease [Alkalihalobacillus sp. 1P02AB]|uniref:FecCD family ABC transporter permease n=1 Tax=Alkalihalobacillus sp. 1P02AB TaxID=3132260 RepID=UPI0039A71ECD
MFNDRKKVYFIYSAVIAVIGLGLYFSLTSGSYSLTVKETFQTLFRMEKNPQYDLIIFDFRLPRIVIGAMVGFGLGTAGAVLQGITRNPLADPGILGINAGAGAAIVGFLFFFQGQIMDVNWVSILAMPLFGWFGGITAVLLILFFATEKGRLDPQTFILVGIAVSAGFGAITLFISLKMNPSDYETAAVWLAGSVYSANWKYVWTILPWVLVLTPLIIYKAKVLDIFSLVDGSIKGLGVSLTKERYLLIFYSVGLVSACVSVSGSIGFVGLIAPHIARQLLGVRHIRILPLSGLIGMAMVVVGDWIGKTIFAPAQLPVGIVISIIGVPYFVYLLFRARKT